MLWWEEYPEIQREEYHNLEEMEYQMLISQDVEILAQDIRQGEMGPVYDVVIARNSYNGKIKVENVPPEEFLISREAKSIEDARFVCHRVRKTLSELRQMYPDDNFTTEDLGGVDGSMMAYNTEELARNPMTVLMSTGAEDQKPRKPTENTGCMSHLSKQTTMMTVLQNSERCAA